jgi:predicted alpha-1,2-mannosidase
MIQRTAVPRAHPCRMLVLLILIAVCGRLSAYAQERPADLVNPLIGTANEGQTFPAVGVPFGMTQWTPATQDGQAKARVPYYFADTRLRGFRGSHFLSGSATQEYGSVQIMMGEGKPDFATGAPSAAFTHADEHATPYLYRVNLRESGIAASMTGTTRCGFLRLSFGHGGKSWALVENFALPGDGEVIVDSQHHEITSRSGVRRLYAGSGRPAGFSGYAVIEFDHPFTAGQSWTGQQPGSPHSAAVPNSTGTWVAFDLKPGEVVNIRIGTSFTSLNEARRNLAAEIPRWDFDAVVRQAAASWNRELRKIEVSGPAPDRRIFYTALYHSMLLPRTFSDADGSYPVFGGGKRIDTARARTYYDDFSIWDTFRAVHPLFTILDPQREADFVQSLIDKGEQGGYLPIFPAWNSYTAEMDGDHAVAIIADAWFKNIQGFDRDRAYALMRKNAFVSPSPQEYADGEGRRALQSYLKFGYIPLEDPVKEAPHVNEQVARTLDYAYDDDLLGRIAQSLSRSSDATILLKRGQNYRNVIDPETGFARGRHADGSWISPFDPAQPASYVTEGLPFQFTFYVLHDIPGLISLEGGPAKFTARLHELFARGLYNHGNEPSHHLAYLYDYSGAAPRTQNQVHRIVTSLYADRPDGLAGNDDAGQMSAWYVFSALGFYPVTPGLPSYAIGTPHFSRASIHLPNGKTFEIEAHHLNAENFYIRSVTLNGKPLNRFWLKHAEIMRGGTLIFEMESQPNPAWPSSSRFPAAPEPAPLGNSSNNQR